MRQVQCAAVVVLCIFQSTHSRGVRLPYIRCNLALIQYFNPRTHEECDRPPMLAFAFVEISIHALTRSATRHLKHPSYIFIISIHALTRSATIQDPGGPDHRMISIHALTRSATLPIHECGDVRLISIHALTRSATVQVQNLPRNYLISIHALTRSATHLQFCKTSIRIFQSTHSRGVRR